MLKLKLSKASAKFLQSLPLKQAKQLDRKLEELAHDPLPQDAKLLKGSSGYYRVDVGEYRIIYFLEIQSEILPILMIGKRNDAEVYKKFLRKVPS